MKSPARRLVGMCCGIAALVASVTITAQTNSTSLVNERNFDGVWDVVTLTPFERPAEFADKPFLTRGEADEYARRRPAEISFERRADTPEADLQQPSINEFWAERGPLMMVDGRYPTAQISDPANGRLPAYTPAAQARWNAQLAARRRASQASDYTTSERCLLQLPLPALRSSTDGSLVKITKTDTHIVIAQEKMPPRLVPIGGRGHLGENVTMWSGDSQARWTGNTFL